MSERSVRVLTKRQLLVYRSVRMLIAGFCRLWFRVEVRGKENIPEHGGFILAPGAHRSYIDTPIVSIVSSRIFRYLGAETYFKMPGLGKFLHLVGGVPVERSMTDREALAKAQMLLERGEPLVVFPEGARFFGPLIEDFKPGTAFLAARAQVPIIPVGIGGAERSLPKGSPWLKPRKVVLVIGEPILPPLSENKRAKRSEVAAFSDELKDSLQTVFDQAQIAAGL